MQFQIFSIIIKMISYQFCTFITFITMTCIYILSSYTIINFCSDILCLLIAIVEIMLLDVHLNALLPSQFTLLSYLIYSKERHHHSNKAITSSGFLHMSGSVTVTTCFAMKFQHRGAPCILLKNTLNGV